jgi:hypothetical protein
MRLLVLLLTTLSTAFSGLALAMGGPVYVDETCVSIKEAHATPALKAWIKRTCPQGEASPDPICKDLSPFIRDVSANNQTLRRKCAGQAQ